MDASKKFVLLAILDGWGISAIEKGNAIVNANCLNMKRLMASFPHTQLGASGDSVGLPRGEVGNTETGHLNLGAGRIIYQDLARINVSIADGSFFDNPVLTGAIDHAQKQGSKLHIMGLVGAGGVHSNAEHLYALIQLAARRNFKEVYVHAFTDGRDSPPTASYSYLQALENLMQKESTGKIASVMGRYWAMDRDLRWDRTAKAYFALTKGEGIKAKSVKEAVDAAYKNNHTDEFIEPTIITTDGTTPIATIQNNDAVIFFNFRIDRPRQLARAFILPSLSVQQSWGFDPYAVKYDKKHTEEKATATPVFERGKMLSNLYFVTMTEYEKSLGNLGAHIAFPPEVIQMPLGRVVSMADKKQLRAAESEKERFVTFYFNGQREVGFENEDHLIVPSPKVKTYDLKPEMSAHELTDKVLARLATGSYDLIVMNFANVDMVGHTGNYEAAVKAVEAVDECVGKLSNYILQTDGTMFITADHGNAEEMLAADGKPSTEHSANPVPFIAISKDFLGRTQTLPSGVLADVAPTIVKRLGLEVPSSMTGRNLLETMRY